MANFDPAFKITSLAEGGYVNDSSDKGGETYKGISRKNFPNWAGWNIIDKAKKQSGFPKNLSSGVDLENAVKEFYKKEFWDVLNLDKFKYQEIANEVYDTGVNMGTYIAAVFLQKTLNVLNRNQLEYGDLPITGKVGSLTTEAANLQKYPDEVVKILNSLQGARYVEICLANPSQEKFIRGWLKRVG